MQDWRHSLPAAPSEWLTGKMPLKMQSIQFSAFFKRVIEVKEKQQCHGGRSKFNWHSFDGRQEGGEKKTGGRDKFI